MQLESLKWGEIILIWPGLFRFMQKVFKTERQARGLACWPFLILRDKEQLQPWLLNHERIHLAQQREMLVLGFTIMQLIEILVARMGLKKTGEETYYWLSFEQEAYLNQHNLNYLKTRPLFAHFKYLKVKKRFRVTNTPGELEFY